MLYFFFFQAEDGIRDKLVTGVQTCALPISFDAHGRAVVAIVIADEEAVVVEILAGQVERGPVVPPRHRHRVLDHVAGRIQLAGVIEYGCPGRNRRSPAAPADPGSDAIA